MRRGHVAMRTCAGCRARVPKASLLRLIRNGDGAVEVDPTGATPGRGAYVHRSARCVETAIVRGGLARALRVGVGEDAAGRLRGLVSEEHG